MKVKTSITLTDALLTDMDKICGGVGNRSAFVEAAIRSRLETIKRLQSDAKDLEILNNQATELNQEAEDILDWQVTL